MDELKLNPSLIFDYHSKTDFFFERFSDTVWYQNERCTLLSNTTYGV